MEKEDSTYEELDKLLKDPKLPQEERYSLLLKQGIVMDSILHGRQDASAFYHKVQMNKLFMKPKSAERASAMYGKEIIKIFKDNRLKFEDLPKSEDQEKVTLQEIIDLLPKEDEIQDGDTSYIQEFQKQFLAMKKTIDAEQNQKRPNSQQRIPKNVPPAEVVLLDSDEEQNHAPKKLGFVTGGQEFKRQQIVKGGSSSGNQSLMAYGNRTKTLGTRRTVTSKFVPPVRQEKSAPSSQEEPELPVDERLKNIDPKMIELITNEIMDNSRNIDWSDIAGLEFAKSIIKEAVVWPLLRPDIFKGLRNPPRGILLFGPPGTGKTLIGKCIASQSKSTFFSISASSLTSKWIGDGEKMVRALFAVALVNQPSVVFIDEIDSLLSQRSDTEHESSRRLKTEFLVQLDGAATSDDDRILIVGATNRPQELDEAARRRLTQRLYIPLPEQDARVQILKKLIKDITNDMSEEQFDRVGRLAHGYSGADMKNLCREAAMEPFRTMDHTSISQLNIDHVRHVTFDDFVNSMKKVKSSVSPKDLEQYVQWNDVYGSGRT